MGWEVMYTHDAVTSPWKRQHFPRKRALEPTGGRFGVPDTRGILPGPPDLCGLVRVVPPDFRNAPGESGGWAGGRPKTSQ